MCPAVTYTLHATSSKEQTGGVITFAQFENGGILTETCNDAGHQAQKGFRVIFIGIPEHQKGYLVYVPSTRKVIYSYNVVFDEMFFSALSYTSLPDAFPSLLNKVVTYMITH